MKRKFKKKRPSTLSKRLAKLERKVKDERPQLRFWDTTGATQNIDTTAVIVKILAGDSDQSRVLIKSIQAKFYLRLASATSARAYYRIVIFTHKKNEDDAMPTWANIYKSASGTDAIMSLRRLDQNTSDSQNYRILYDKLVWLINDADAEIKDKVFFDMFKKLNIHSINDDNNTFWEQGGLYLGYVGTTATDGADLDYQIRTRFEDKTSI